MTHPDATPAPADLLQPVQDLLPWVTPAQLDTLHRLGTAFQDWNAKINMVSRKDIGNLWEHHVLYSCVIAKATQFTPGTRLLDLGTGGGFPGLPLAVLFPDAQFTLLDATAKKVRVVDELAAYCGIANANTRWGRAEDLHKPLGQHFDFVLGRAVTALPDFWRLARPFLHCNSRNSLPNGVLYLKGGALENELTQIKAAATVYPLADWLPQPYFETKLLVHLTPCR